MKNTILQVEGMSCKHCVNAIEGALAAANGVAEVFVDLGKKTASVKHDESVIAVEGLTLLIEEQGFDVAAIIACEDD